ncbi:hypothetical protein Bca101_010236 [Brassica carinata]
MAHQAEEAVANKAAYKQDEKKVLICDHCKKKGHMKDKCWILHPHLKPNKFKEPRFQDARAHLSTDGNEPVTPSSVCSNNNGGGSAMASTSIGLWEHVTSSSAPKQITQGEDGKEIVVVDEGKWGQEDLLVLSILHSSLDGPLMDTYSHCETPKQLWDTLQRVYGNTSNLTRIYEVKRAINNLQQEEGDFTKHLGKYSQLWSELEMLRPSSNDPETLEARREQDKVFGLFFTLSPSFNDVVRHILREKELPSYDEVCAQLQKEIGSDGLFGGGKGELSMVHKAEKVESASANKAYSKPRGGGDKSVTCEHCKYKGHSKNNCWILHPHLRPASANKPYQARAHEARAQEQPAPSYMRMGDDGKALVSTTHTVLNLLYHALGDCLRPNTRPLIIDSGASHHMISDSSLIKNVKPALGNVMIANGDKIPIRGVGKLKLFDKETDAFYMPRFESNLLSVKRATVDLGCQVVFRPEEVEFQDLKTGRVIGRGDSKNQLYHLQMARNPKPFESVCLSSTTKGVDSSTWHARLGHPHARAMELIFPNMSFNHLECEACILGKHCRTVFPTSTTTYEHCFDLVHSDVWTAPCMSRDSQKYFVTFIDEKSKYTWLTLLPSKDRVLEAFMNFQVYVSNQYNASVKILSSAPKQITQGEDGKEIVVIDEGKWVQEDLMVLSILHSSLDGPLMDTYSHCTTPKQLWDTLQRVYGNTSNLTRIYEVKRAINTLQQEEGDFTKHLGKYSQLWSELEMLRPSSNDPETIEARREQDKIFGLLFTLSPSFNDVVRHILREKDLPSYDEVCAQLQKEIGSDGLFGGGKGDLSMAHKVEKVESASANKAHFKPRGGGDKSVTCQPQQINTARPESMKQELRSIQHPAICAWEMMVEP